MTAAFSIPEQWKPAGSTYNTRYFVPSDGVLIVLPEQGLKDDGPSARVNVEFQANYARSLGRPCAVIVILDSLTSQDSEARRIYAAGMEPHLFFAAALVVASPLARAIGSFFLGLSRPPFPTQLFHSIDAAHEWVVSLPRNTEPS